MADAKAGKLDNIPSDVLIRSYSSLTRISVDFAEPLGRGKQDVTVLWGPSGSGKSKYAFDNAGINYYIKSPLTKWWDGYRSQDTVIVDEFRGVVAISHLLKWLDIYPCAVEKKGSQVYLHTKRWFITSNLEPKEWYPLLDEATFGALKRRITLTIHKLSAFELMMPVNFAERNFEQDPN